jgi:hypothetical protein
MELPPSPNEAHRGEGEFFLRRQTPQFQVPAGVIIPNKIENLLVSSAVSATHVAYGALRMEPVRMIMGQAAGTLAALSLQYRQRPDEIKIDLLQDKLLDQNVYLAWFTDITPTSRHFKGIQFLGARGLFPNLQFEPEQQVTRGEAARWIFGLRQLLDPSLRPNTFGGPHYDDVPVSSPLFPYVESLYAAKIIQGGGKFKPQEPLARGEMARWLMLTMRQYDPKWGTKTTEAPVYTDVSEDSPMVAAIRGLAAEHINARSWRDPEGNTGESTNFYPGSAIERDDFAMTLFLAYRSIHPAF